MYVQEYFPRSLSTSGHSTSDLAIGDEPAQLAGVPVVRPRAKPCRISTLFVLRVSFRVSSHSYPNGDCLLAAFEGPGLDEVSELTL